MSIISDVMTMTTPVLPEVKKGKTCSERCVDDGGDKGEGELRGE